MAGVAYTDLDGLPDNLLIHRFEMNFGVIPRGGDSTLLKLKCQTCDFPGSMIEPVQWGLQGHQGVQPGRHISNNEYMISFIEGRDGALYNALAEWKNAARDIITGNSDGPMNGAGGSVAGINLGGLGGGGGAGAFAVDARLDVLNESGSPAVSCTIRKTWCREIQAVSLDGQTSQLFLIQASMAFNRVEYLSGNSSVLPSNILNVLTRPGIG